MQPTEAQREFALRRLITVRAHKARLGHEIATRAQRVAVRALRAGDSSHRAAQSALGPYLPGTAQQGGAQ